MIQLECRKVKLCQMKVLNLLLHQIIVLIQDWIILIILNFKWNFFFFRNGSLSVHMLIWPSKYYQLLLV